MDNPSNGLAAQRAQRKLDLAARAAWLYYIGGNTQDEIANKLNVSRQAAQRLVALAVAERIVRVHLGHPLTTCMTLGEALRQRFDLQVCDIAPADSGDPVATLRGVALLAAQRLERDLAQKGPLIVAVGSGRTMRAVVGELPAMDLPQHRVVGLVGSIARDGRANPFEVVMRLADRIGAECYPLPAPGIVESVAERNLWQAQRGYRRLAELASRAQLTYLGIGHLGRNAPLLEDGFITDAERQNLLEWGAVGEMLGWPFDRYGQLLDAPLTERVTSLRLPQPPERLTILIGTGPAKVEAIVAALQGRCVNGIVTDEATVRAVLEATSGGSQKALDSETEAV